MSTKNLIAYMGGLSMALCGWTMATGCDGVSLVEAPTIRNAEAGPMSAVIADASSVNGCPPGDIACDEACVDPQTSLTHCGATAACKAVDGTAGETCGSGRVCSLGACAISCAPTLLQCGATCLDPKTSLAHCGATTCGDANASDAGDPSDAGGGGGVACARGEVCSQGVCAVSCQAGLVQCNGICINPQTSRTHCGATVGCGVGASDAGSGSDGGSASSAGTACASGNVCSLGTCSVTCAPGLVRCDDTCIDPLTSRTYCGASAGCGVEGGAPGTACVDGNVCNAGTCELSCQAGFVDCGGTCVDPLTSRTNCAATAGCGVTGGLGGLVCGLGTVCNGTSCAVSCPTQLVDCSGTCFDPQTSRNHCGATTGCGVTGGASGNVCGPGQVCSTGACALSCPSDLLDCGGTCIDPLTSRIHCGASATCSAMAGTAGDLCDLGEVCNGVSCVASCQMGFVACGGLCVDPQSNRNHCGATVGCGVTGGLPGTACDDGEVCNNGSCAVSCHSSLIACDGTCFDPQTSPEHCGATSGCGVTGGSAGAACPPLHACVAGACRAVIEQTTITVDTNLSVTNLNGRTCVDGGDMVAYSVDSFPTGNSATLTTTASAGCLSIGDSVLVANLQGTLANTANVGNYELLTVASLATAGTTTVTFSAAKTKFYGDNAFVDTNIGTSRTQQRVVLQRVPRYNGVFKVETGATVRANAWNGVIGGIFSLSANRIQVNGTISASGDGFAGAIYNPVPNRSGDQGESYTGLGFTGLTHPNQGSSPANAGAGGGGTGDSNACRPFGVSGGGGGYGSNGAASGDPICGGLGGATYGDPVLAQLFLGSGGGSGGTDDTLSDNPPGGFGGAGGGIIFLKSDNAVSGTGAIRSEGTIGQGDIGINCAGAMSNTSACWDFSGPGGGGSGGSIRIEASSVGVARSVAGGHGGYGYVGVSNSGGDGGSGRSVP